MKKQQFETTSINKMKMMMEKQQHETGNINRTDTINLEIMQKDQHETGNINGNGMLMKKQQCNRT